MSSVLAFKLVGGEEIVAEVLEEKRSLAIVDGLGSPTEITAYVLRRPHILRFQPIGPNQIGLAFVPWTLSNPEINKLELPAKSVLLTFEPSANVEKQYLEQTSGIALAKQVPTGRISS